LSFCRADCIYFVKTKRLYRLGKNKSSKTKNKGRLCGGIFGMRLLSGQKGVYNFAVL